MTILLNVKSTIKYLFKLTKKYTLIQTFGTSRYELCWRPDFAIYQKYYHTLNSNCSRWKSEGEDEKDLSKFKVGYILHVWMWSRSDIVDLKKIETSEAKYINPLISKCQNSSLDHVYRHFYISSGHINM